MKSNESDVIGRDGSVIIFRVKRSDSSLVVGRDSVREKGNAFAYRTGHRVQVTIWLPMAAIDDHQKYLNCICSFCYYSHMSLPAAGMAE